MKSLTLLDDQNINFLVIGDIHGHHKELKKLIEMVKKKYDLNALENKLIFLGDYIDRGPSCIKTLIFLKKIKKEFDCHLLLGNHEHFFLTTDSFYGPSDINVENKVWIRKFLDSVGLFWIETTRFLFIHGGPLSSNDDLESLNPSDFLSNYDAPLDGWKGKVIVRGHKCVEDVTVEKNLISVDTNVGCPTGEGQLTCAVLSGSTGELKETISINNLKIFKS